eukprot:1435533-Amphidinium_carterae.1
MPTLTRRTLLRPVDDLHEGVLYWMDKKDIEDLMAQARRGEKDAEKRMENYYTDMKRLEITLRLEYEENNGKIEEKEEFITALETKDDKTLKPMLYQYAKDLRDRRARWRDGKIDEENKKKDEYRKKLQREEDEKQKKRDQERDQEAAAALASTSLPVQPTGINMEPPMPKQALFTRFRFWF